LRRALLKCVVALSVATAAVGGFAAVRSRFAADAWVIGGYGFKSNAGKLRVWETTAGGGARVLAEVPYNAIAWAGLAIALWGLARMLIGSRRPVDSEQDAAVP
jgi:hypothetical protein